MRKRAGIFLCITTVIAGIAVSIAQEKNADTQASGSASLTSGTLMVAELSRGLNTRHLKVGDIVKAKVIQDVIAEGRIVVPRDSKMLGLVVEVKKSNKEDRESTLVVMFEQVRLRRGGEAKLHGVIQAVAPPIPRVDHPDQLLPPNLGGGGGRSSGSPQPIGTSASGASRSNSGMGTVTTGRGQGTVGAANVPPADPTGAQTTPSGALSAGARGVIGIPDLALRADASNGTVRTVLRSRKGNINLDGGTQIVVRVIPDVQPRPTEKTGAQ
ncbi:MAG TPA: hypothetical protein VFK06_07000 [Candidatus Angelobacter sp.]|nr:hypothetical protein [Candidatus Angelobacter sp.]